MELRPLLFKPVFTVLVEGVKNMQREVWKVSKVGWIYWRNCLPKSNHLCIDEKWSYRGPFWFHICLKCTFLLIWVLGIFNVGSNALTAETDPRGLYQSPSSAIPTSQIVGEVQDERINKVGLAGLI